jgi:DNA-binding NarL/FixJ family response regulator
MNDNEKASFVLVEDHVGVAEALSYALCAQLPLRMAAHCDRVSKALVVCAEIKPALVIFDWRMPEGEGVALPRALAQTLPQTRWLLYTAFPSAFVVRAAVEAGTHGCVSKGASHLELVKACQELLAGRTYFCQTSAQALRVVLANRARDSALNATEQKILYYVAYGMEPKDISLSVGVSVGTVRNYMVQIRQKLGVSSMVNLAKYAVDHGFAPPQ